MADLKDELEKLAAAIVTEANSAASEVPFAEKIEALEQLTKLYIAFQKHPAEDDEEDVGFDFSKGVQPASQDQANGSARVQPRRRPTPAGAAVRDSRTS